MESLEKEQILHKVVAAGAFVFALSILPVAQYFLVTNQIKSDTGQVAGVQTVASPSPTTTVLGDVAATPVDKDIAGLNKAQCQAKTTSELADLQKFLDGKKKALLRDYNLAVDPYNQAMAVLSGSPESISQGKAALKGLIDTEYQKYLGKLSAVQKAVDAQQQTLTDRLCPDQ